MNVKYQFDKRREIPPKYYDARSQKQRRIASHLSKRCGVCTYEVPAEDIIIEDGREVCPMCRDLYTAEWLANEEAHVAMVKDESARRLVKTADQISLRSLNESTPGAVTLITDANGNVLGQSSQLLVKRSTAFTVLLVGQYFTNSNSVTYSTGMTDNSAQTITPALITLNPVAAATMTPGSYGITFNDGISKYPHIFPYLFAVR